MIKFEYTFLDLRSFDVDNLSGFNVSFGNLEDWDDVVISYMTRGRKHIDSTSIKVPQEWLDRVCNFLKEQTQLRPLSSWIFKSTPHSSEHQITIEVDGWYREIFVYNLGEFGRHLHPNFKEEEIILLEFFTKIQELLKEVGINLKTDKISSC